MKPVNDGLISVQHLAVDRKSSTCVPPVDECDLEIALHHVVYFYRDPLIRQFKAEIFGLPRLGQLLQNSQAHKNDRADQSGDDPIVHQASPINAAIDTPAKIPRERDRKSTRLNSSH